MIEVVELVSHDEALVNQCARGEAAYIEVGVAGQVVAQYGLLGLLAYGEQPKVELELAQNGLGAPDEELSYSRPDPRRQDAYLVRGHRYVAPSEEALSLLLDDALDDGLAMGALIVVGRQESHADAVVSGLGNGYPQRAELPRYELVRHLDDYARAIPCFGVSASRAAMSEVYQDFQALLDNAMRLSPLDVGDESDPTCLVLERGIVQSVGGETGRVFLVITVAHSYALNRFTA